VKIMGDIYKFAFTVVIWVGENDDYTGIAFGTLKRKKTQMSHIREW